MNTDVYYHKTVSFRAWKHTLQFQTSQQLFSSHDVDIGTKFLLRTIVEAGYICERVLDIGCGYGPLGLTLKSLHPESEVHLIDRDALALVYSRRNAAFNGLTGVKIYPSLGYDDVPRTDFDLIASNIPGKAGESVIAYLLQEARYYLASGGIAAIVVVSPLEELVAKVLSDTPHTEIILRRLRSSHAVFHYRFGDKATPPKLSTSTFERGIYRRQDVTMRLDTLQYAIQTAYGLPEFDSLSYTSQMLIKALPSIKERAIHRVVVFNPGQGHVPAALAHLLHPQNIALVDRDLLALQYSRLNLIATAFPAQDISLYHQTGIDLNTPHKADLVIGALREDDSKTATFLTLDEAAKQLAPDGLIVLAAGSTAITRLISYLQERHLLGVKTRERWRGYSLLVLAKLDSGGKKR